MWGIEHRCGTGWNSKHEKRSEQSYSNFSLWNLVHFEKSLAAKANDMLHARASYQVASANRLVRPLLTRYTTHPLRENLSWELSFMWTLTQSSKLLLTPSSVYVMAVVKSTTTDFQITKPCLVVLRVCGLLFEHDHALQQL